MSLLNLVPTMVELSAHEAEEVPGLAKTVAYWTGRDLSAEEWFREVEDDWGSPGLVVRRGSEILGYAIHAPLEYLPRALSYPLGPLSQDAILVAYASGDTRTRKHLLARVLRESRLRGADVVESIGNDAGISAHHLATRHLTQSGWEPVNRGYYKGLYYTLTRAELGNAVEVGDFARGLIGCVKIPSIGRIAAPVPGRVPSTYSGYGGDFNRSNTSQRPPRKECSAKHLTSPR